MSRVRASLRMRAVCDRVTTGAPAQEKEVLAALSQSQGTRRFNKGLFFLPYSQNRHGKAGK